MQTGHEQAFAFNSFEIFSSRGYENSAVAIQQMMSER